MKRIAFVSLGCDKNLVDSEIALGKLVSAGYNFFSSLEEAQVLVLNTCAFIDDARRETEEWIRKFVSLKKKDPRKVLVVMGCYVERIKEKALSLYPEVDYWIGVNDFPHIVEILKNGEHSAASRLFIDGPPFLYDHGTERLLATPSHYAYIKIAEGCNNHCSFCVIPLIRGPLRSRPWEDIIQEALNLVEMGVREIILVAQDLSSYGLDLYHRRSLPFLLKKLGENLPSSVWLRLLYVSPYGIDDQLLEVVASTRQVVKYLDVPLQHINARILQGMNRPFSRAQLEEQLLRIRTFIPGVFLRTTLMVGFPGEDEEIFEELLNFVYHVRFERMGVFCYSSEPGTPAFTLNQMVEETVKRERYQILMHLQEGVMEEIHRGLVGQTVEVILEEGPQSGGKRYLWGRTYGDAPQVDCRIKVWVTGKKRFVPGTILQVRVKKGSAYELEGEIV
ncbi:MAG: 30S ribosomal protein S12 methylthiotransferase RimO [Atribacterota bacterium]